MASPRQIAANRLNGSRSTGPRTLAGKRRSRRNALRHGLTAETVVDVFERPEDYRRFHQDFVDAFEPRSAIEHALVGRLASVLWRLRRATAIEASLLAMHGHASRAQTSRKHGADIRSLPHVSPPHPSVTAFPIAAVRLVRTTRPEKLGHKDLAQAFLRLCNLSGDTFERLGRYEVMLWRQAAQIILLLSGSNSHDRPPAP